jgi:hypothetical protein
MGVDPCAGVSCPAADSCHLAATCSGGVCYGGAALATGTACNDNNAATANDACDASGVCRGTTIVTGAPTRAPTRQEVCGTEAGPGGCALPDQCHLNATCSSGICFLGAAVANGVTCDDGNNDTINDVCTAGVCAGVDPCANMSCPPTMGECYADGYCTRGECVYTTRPDGSTCSDGDNSTVGDACYSGLCVGFNPCALPPSPLPLLLLLLPLSPF